MRNISATALATIAQAKGIEPIIIIKISWKDGQESFYADRKFPGIEGKLLSISNLEDVINISQSAASKNINITLDDTDNTLKEIFNYNDIHKRPVYVYQWFSGLSLNDKFLLFRGQIASPIIWKEGDRTLSFEVINIIEDQEVGFSPEEGEFDFIPRNLIGVPWPLVFGTVEKLPTVRVDEIPYGNRSDTTRGVTNGNDKTSYTLDPTGIADPTIDPKIAEAQKNAAEASQLAILYFLGYLQASSAARRAGELGDLDDITRGNGTFSGLAQQYLDLGNQYLLESQQINRDISQLEQVLHTQEEHQKERIRIANGRKFPQGRPITLNIGGAAHTGVFVGDTFVVEEREHPDIDLVEGLPNSNVVNIYNVGYGGQQAFPQDPYIITRRKFFYAQEGTFVKIHKKQKGRAAVEQLVEEINPPVRYICSSFNYCTVLNAFAYRTVNDIRSLYSIPPEYYLSVNILFGTLKVTMLYFSQPLSSRDEGWEDDVYATLTSELGPNTVDIIQWLIETYTNFSVDPTSFTAVKAKVEPYPSHFALFDRPNVISLIQDIAFQARCTIWLNDDVFHLKYLPEEDVPIETINESDIELESLELTGTETEDIVTKLVATWKPDYLKTKDYKIIFRHNVNKYGTQERRYDFYIYNIQQLVEKSAIFWLIRMANTYKRISCRVPLTKLKIETMDTVTFDFSRNWIANENINGLIEEASYDSNSNSINIQAWLPVRLGEMTKYPFAFPADLTVQYIFPVEDDPNAGSAGPGKTAKLPTNTVNSKYERQFSSEDDTSNSQSQPSPGQLRVTRRPYDWGGNPQYIIDENNQTPQISTQIDTTNFSKTPEPDNVNSYQYKQYKVEPQKVSALTTTVMPCRIKSGTGDTYTVNAYPKGLTSQPIEITGVKQMIIDPDDTIPPDTPAILIRLVFEKDNGAQNVEHYINVPTWIEQPPM